MLLPPALTDAWLPRLQQIFPAEAIALPLALAVLAPHVRDRDILAFCDNAAAVSALVRGASRVEDATAIAELFTALQLQLAARNWIDWVDSDSNPADGLSRAGVHDDWTLSQGWHRVLLGIRRQLITETFYTLIDLAHKNHTSLSIFVIFL